MVPTYKQNKVKIKKGERKFILFFKTLFITSLFANFGLSVGLQGFVNVLDNLLLIFIHIIVLLIFPDTDTSFLLILENTNQVSNLKLQEYIFHPK